MDEETPDVMQPQAEKNDLGQTVIRGEVIRMDYRKFTDVVFVGCTMVYAGGHVPSMVNTSFDHCSFAFDNEARNTLDFLRMLISGGPEARNTVLNEMLAPTNE